MHDTFASIYTFYFYYRQLPSSKRFLVTEILLIYSWTSVKQCFFTISSLFKLWEYPSYSHRKKLNPSKILIYINKFHIKQELINIFRWQYTLSKYSINRLYHSGLEHENYKSFKKSSVYELQIWYLHSRVKQITSITTCILF